MNTTTTISWNGPGAGTRALQSEWSKLRTLRSTWITMIAAATLSIMLAAIVAASQLAEWDELTAAQRSEIDPISASLVGMLFATVIVGALGVRTTAGEAATGIDSITLIASQRRSRVLIAKAAVVAALILPAVLAVNIVSFAVGQAVFADKQLNVPISSRDAVRAIGFGAIAATATGVLGVALGSLLRRAAMATTLLAVAIIGSQLFAIALPASARRYLPGLALQAAVSADHADELLAPAAGLATFVAYAVIAFVAALAVAAAHDR